MRLSAAIDALNRLPQDVKDELFGETWKLMFGMRNRIAHGYAAVDSDTIRITVEEELPPMVEKIRTYKAGA